MKSTLFSLVAVVLLAGVCSASELPDAPSSVASPEPIFVESTAPAPVHTVAESRTVDGKFLTLTVISTASTFADSYTTLFATQNWRAGKKGVCNVEVQSPYLYGTHPTAGRAYTVAAIKSASSFFGSYYLRKHHHRFWSLPLVVNSVLSLQGTTQNMIGCN